MTATTASAPASATAARIARPKKNRKRGRVSKVILSIVAVALSIVWIFPVYWMVNSAFLPTARLESAVPTFFPGPGQFTWGNFAKILEPSRNFLPSLWASLQVTLVTVVAALLFAFLGALAISRFRFRGRKATIVTILLIQMLPAEGLFIAQYRMLSSMGLLSLVGLMILYTASVVPFTMWTLRGFVQGVPMELEEAGMVDGLSKSGAFFRITFPLLAPGLVASGVFAFLQAWNEFTLATVILSASDDKTLPIWLRTFLSNNQNAEWGAIMAGSTLIAIPVVIFFMIVQTRMTEGLVSGAVKG